MPEGIQITDYHERYADAVADLFTAAVHAVADSDYGQAQKLAWAPKPPDYEAWRGRLAKKLPLLALHEGALVGFLELDADGHIDCFYVMPAQQGRGVGRALFRRAEETATLRGLPRLYAEVSLTARSFFFRRGFEIVGSNSNQRSGQILKNFSMQRLRPGLELVRPSADEALPYDLFLQADPSRAMIDSYHAGADVFLLREAGHVLGGVIFRVSGMTAEIKNIAVDPKLQGRGIGKLLLHSMIREAGLRGLKTLFIGTGNSSIGQLHLYQRMGFELSEIRRNFFVENYSEPIWENGIECRHMLMLEKTISFPGET